MNNKAHRDQDIAQLMSTYGLESLLKRREKHHLSLMYRLKDDKDLLEQYRANIELRNDSRLKFKTRTTKLTKVANSRFIAGLTGCQTLQQLFLFICVLSILSLEAKNYMFENCDL